MKIAIISDIHGNLPALQAVLGEIDRAGVDHIINVGDTLGGPLESARTADLLMARGIAMIAGNHERQLLTFSPEKLSRSDVSTASEISSAHRAWLASAPPRVGCLTTSLFATARRTATCTIGLKQSLISLAKTIHPAYAPPRRPKYLSAWAPAHTPKPA